MKARPRWSTLLSLARQSVELSQDRLAAVSGVSLGSIKAYESGRRHATRPKLAALLDAMKISRAIRNEVLTAAGFAADDENPIDPTSRRIKREEALEEIGRYRWPSMLISENAEILGANVAARKLWQIEPFGTLFKLGDPAITVATHPEIIKRLVNWEEAVSQQIAGWKSQIRGEESLDEPSPYFARVLEQLGRGEPDYVRRFIELWETTRPGFHVEHRWAYRIHWLEPGFGHMRFQCFAWVVNDRDGLDIDDWIPADAETWYVLDRFLGHVPD